MKLAFIGDGAIASYAKTRLELRGHQVVAHLMRPERVAEAAHYVASVRGLSQDIDHVVDCAGHEALRHFGPEVLAAGFDLTTVSIGALADQALADRLATAAASGGARLYLASGAIGALDALRAANIGTLRQVRYTGRKPPKGWAGSRAEEVLDLSALTAATAHFSGTARQAALEYPKNANVAAAVALAGLGFDATEVALIADPGVTANIHEIHAEGDFGHFDFKISGDTLPGNPRTSALAAMSIVSLIDQLSRAVRF